jgi:hypothetical protein
MVRTSFAEKEQKKWKRKKKKRKQKKKIRLKQYVSLRYCIHSMVENNEAKIP